MSKSLTSLDNGPAPKQLQRYEHVAHDQLEQHMSPQVRVQRVGRTERVQFLLREDEVEVVDGFRFANRCSSRSDAIRTLMKRGLQAATEEQENAR